MMFVDTNVFMYAVGRPHTLQLQARSVFTESERNDVPLFTSAEGLQELLHAYLPVGRVEFFEAALALIVRFEVTVWALEQADVALARQLHERYPHLSARDLCHLASCIRNDVSEIKTFDRGLQLAFSEEMERDR